MVSPRTQSIIDRIASEHPVAKTVRSAMIDMLGAAEQFAAKKGELEKSGTYTQVGMQKALRDALPGVVKQVVVARAPIDKMQTEIKTRRAALKKSAIDPNNVVAALERMELRAWIASLPTEQRMHIALTSEDTRVMTAITSAPPALSGFEGNLEHAYVQVEQRFVELLNADELKSIAELEEIAAEGLAAANVATNDLVSLSGMSPKDIETMAGSIARGAPWLKRQKDINGNELVVVVKPGETSYPEATADDLTWGRFYANADEWQAAQQTVLQ
jgi:hypothetical protein